MTHPVVTNRSPEGSGGGVWYQTPTPGTGVATRLAEAARPFLGGDLPVRLRAWDGSEAGPVDGPLVELRTPDAVRRLLWHPGELGAAQAYVTGELEVHETGGWDLDRALTHAFAVARDRRLGGRRPSPAAVARARAHGRRSRRPGSPAGRPGVAGEPARAAAQRDCATGARSATTTTSPPSSTR